MALKYTLQKDGIRKVLFHEGKTVEFQKGYILDEKNEKAFRYTHSTEPILGKYRVTLHREVEGDYKTYTFALSNKNDHIHIECENAQAIELTRPLSGNIIDITFHQLLTLIMKDGIQKQHH